MRANAHEQPHKPVPTLNRPVSLRPRNDTFNVSQGRTVLATQRDGFIEAGIDHGLFVHQTRLLSRYRYLIDGNPPVPVALSNIEQHSGLAYYITLPPGVETGEPDQGSGQMKGVSQQSLELRISRYAGKGVHEDIDLTNFTRETTSSYFEIELDADFADQIETEGERRQRGESSASGVAAEVTAARLSSNTRRACTSRFGIDGDRPDLSGMRLRIQTADSAPSYENGRIGFRIELVPQGSWHACINMIPRIEGHDGAALRLSFVCRRA